MGADTVFFVVVLLRFTVPLFIPKYPLPAILAALVLDAADQTIFSWVTDDPLPGYQLYDKALDIYYLSIAYITTMRIWRSPVAFQLSRFLFLYRLVGVLLHEEVAALDAHERRAGLLGLQLEPRLREVRITAPEHDGVGVERGEAGPRTGAADVGGPDVEDHRLRLP